jgi:tRNA pseudouridine55 synthase
VNGILLVDKPSGWTSNDVVQKLRGILHERRIGHAGTLDPMATGLLTVFVGRATRAVEFAEADAKRYRAALRLGLTTDTQDITGTVLHQTEADVTREALEQALQGFRGEIRQVPPMYSAVKVNGERLYKLARRGETVERAARTVTIHGLDLLGREGEDWILDIRCSKGTYIRTLCQDIGYALGCGGCMAALRRLEAGAFTIEEAHALDEIAQAASEGRAETLLLPVDTLFRGVAAETVGAAAEKKIRNGNTFRTSLPDGTLRLYSETGEFLALARAENGVCRTIKSFFEVETT